MNSKQRQCGIGSFLLLAAFTILGCGERLNNSRTVLRENAESKSIDQNGGLSLRTKCSDVIAAARCEGKRAWGACTYKLSGNPTCARKTYSSSPRGRSSLPDYHYVECTCVGTNPESYYADYFRSMRLDCESMPNRAACREMYLGMPALFCSNSVTFNKTEYTGCTL